MKKKTDNTAKERAVAADILTTEKTDDLTESSSVLDEEQIEISSGVGTIKKGILFDSNEQAKKPKTIELSKKSIIIAIAVVLILVIAAIVLAYVLPVGSYERQLDADGNSYIVEGSYAEDASLGRIPWWKVVLSPFLVLGSDGSLTLWSIIALLIVIGAVFTALDKTGVLIYMVESLRYRFSNKKYILLFLLPFAFMFLGSSAGMFEELIPLVPVVILLSYGLGWDALVGLGISVLATGIGFTAGVVNPFTVGIAQDLIGIPMFSGISLRLLTFVVGYIILMAFIFPYAKKLDRNPKKSTVYNEDLLRKKDFDFENREFVFDESKSKAIKWFAAWLIVVVSLAVISIFIQPQYIPALGEFALADYILYITVAIYIVAGIGACIICGLKGKSLATTMLKGGLSLLPAVAMILIASGIRYIIEEGNVMDTILYKVISAADGQNTAVIILLIYLAIIIFEIFIPSGSAKAFLLMPMIGAMCAHLGINGQVAVLAFAYGDGMVNVFMPSNAGLLLILGMTTVNYPKWFKWAGPILLCMFAASIGILMLAQFVVYA